MALNFIQIDIIAFFYLLLAVAVFIFYLYYKGKGKRPTIAEEVAWEEMTIEQALNEYNPATAAAMPQLSSVEPLPPPPPPPVVAASPPLPAPEPVPEPTPEPEIRSRAMPKLNTPAAYKRPLQRRIRKAADLQQPFVFNPRDAILYEIIWKRKY